MGKIYVYGHLPNNDRFIPLMIQTIDASIFKRRRFREMLLRSIYNNFISEFQNLPYDEIVFTDCEAKSYWYIERSSIIYRISSLF